MNSILSALTCPAFHSTLCLLQGSLLEEAAILPAQIFFASLCCSIPVVAFSCALEYCLYHTTITCLPVSPVAPSSSNPSFDQFPRAWGSLAGSWVRFVPLNDVLNLKPAPESKSGKGGPSPELLSKKQTENKPRHKHPSTLGRWLVVSLKSQTQDFQNG